MAGDLPSANPKPSNEEGNSMLNFRWFWITNLVVSLLLLGGARHHAKAAPFYEGKTLTVVVGTSPGGTGDFRARAARPNGAASTTAPARTRRRVIVIVFMVE